MGAETGLFPAPGAHRGYQDLLPKQYGHSQFSAVCNPAPPDRYTNNRLDCLGGLGTQILFLEAEIVTVEGSVAVPLSPKAQKDGTARPPLDPRAILSKGRETFSGQRGCFTETGVSGCGVTRDNTFRSDNLRSFFWQLFDYSSQAAAPTKCEKAPLYKDLHEQTSWCGEAATISAS